MRLIFERRERGSLRNPADAEMITDFIEFPDQVTFPDRVSDANAGEPIGL